MPNGPRLRGKYLDGNHSYVKILNGFEVVDQDNKRIGLYVYEQVAKHMTSSEGRTLRACTFVYLENKLGKFVVAIDNRIKLTRAGVATYQRVFHEGYTGRARIIDVLEVVGKSDDAQFRLGIYKTEYWASKCRRRHVGAKIRRRLAIEIPDGRSTHMYLLSSPLYNIIGGVMIEPRFTPVGEILPEFIMNLRKAS